MSQLSQAATCPDCRVMSDDVLNGNGCPTCEMDRRDSPVGDASDVLGAIHRAKGKPHFYALPALVPARELLHARFD